MSAADLKAVKLARLPYVNTIPFFLDEGLEPSLSASPRNLGDEAAEGRVDAGPFSLADTWRLEGEFEPLGDFGIAVKGPARSVLLFSKAGLEELNGARVGVTDQTATSVRLLEVLLGLRDGVKPAFARGFSEEDAARLVIGDQALLEAERLKVRFPRVFDLGREWYLWRERPFVFARWAVRRALPPFLKEELKERLAASLRKFEKDPDAAVRRARERVDLPAARLRDYLMGFTYRLTAHELESERLFRSLCADLARGPSC